MSELIFKYKHYKTLAGTDEAGRGCLAGPVVAAAVILKKPIKLLNDSKKLSKNARNSLRLIIEQEALAFGVAFVGPREIETINILHASILAMHQALDILTVDPQIVLVDGNRFKQYKDWEHETVIKGDGKYQCIAAASILAKTYRDEYMDKMHLQFPHYGWDTNAGYPTIKHRNGILEYGACELHRNTFRLLPEEVRF
jgi:ribonuclease HII